MDRHATRASKGADDLASARARAVKGVVAATQAHLAGEASAPLYLATGRAGTATGILGAAATVWRAERRGERLLACTGADFVELWRNTLRRGMTPVVRRALAANHAVLLNGMEALHGEPVAQWELAGLIAPGRLVVLAGQGHLRHVAAWSPTLAACLADARGLCLHMGPCVADADAWALIDRVAGYYGLTRATLLSRRRPAHIALARQVAMHLLRQEGLTATRVGRLLRRDHATVLHGDAHIRQLTTRRPDLRYDLDALHRATAA